MIVSYVFGSGSFWGPATNDMLNNFKTLLTAYSNITFVEKYLVDSNEGIWRYIYAVDGFDKYYLTFQNGASYNNDVVFSIFIRGNEHTDAYVYQSIWNGSGILGANDTYVAEYKFYAIANNGVLKAFTLLGKEHNITYQMICFVKQSTNNYIIYQSGYDILALVNNTNHSIYIINYNNFTFNTNEKALKKNAIITQSYEVNSLYIDQIDSMWHLINNQFSEMTFALIKVSNVKYRQVYGYCLFIEDGDTE